MSTAVTVTRYVQVRLTETQRREKSEELAKTINDKHRLEEHFAKLREQHKANLKARDVTINELAQEIEQGFMMQQVACLEEPDLESGEMVTYRVDTHAPVGRRNMTAEELKQHGKAKR